MINKADLLLTATLANLLDLTTSYLDFSLLGLQELNYYATALHINNYLAAAMAFTAYEALMAIIYLATFRYPRFRWFMTVFIVMKFIAVAGNIAASMGIYNINNTIIGMNQSLTNALKY